MNVSKVKAEQPFGTGKLVNRQTFFNSIYICIFWNEGNYLECPEQRVNTVFLPKS